MPLCKKCARDFVDKDALKQHLRNSMAHARQSHRPDEAQPKIVQISPSQPDSDTRPASDNKPVPGFQMLQMSSPPQSLHYSGVAPSLVKPVFRMACNLRRDNPTVQLIREKTKSALDDVVIAALINAAERLNSLNENDQQARDRAQKQRQRSQLAQVAEDNFAECVASKGYSFEREADQRAVMISTTGRIMAPPDIRLHWPILICGFRCAWLEYKHYFGFPANPFIAAKEKKQMKRYITEIGPGALIYAIGFQSDYPSIEGLAVFRVEELLRDLPYLAKDAMR